MMPFTPFGGGKQAREREQPSNELELTQLLNSRYNAGNVTWQNQAPSQESKTFNTHHNSFDIGSTNIHRFNNQFEQVANEASRRPKLMALEHLSDHSLVSQIDRNQPLFTSKQEATAQYIDDTFSFAGKSKLNKKMRKTSGLEAASPTSESREDGISKFKALKLPKAPVAFTQTAQNEARKTRKMADHPEQSRKLLQGIEPTARMLDLKAAILSANTYHSIYH